MRRFERYYGLQSVECLGQLSGGFQCPYFIQHGADRKPLIAADSVGFKLREEFVLRGLQKILRLRARFEENGLPQETRSLAVLACFEQRPSVLEQLRRP